MNEIIDSFSNRLNEAIRIRNIKPIELSEKTGIDKSKISSYMNGRYKAKQKGVYLLAKALNVSEAWLMGLDVPMERNIQVKPKRTVKVPILGYIRAGIPIDAITETVGDYFITEKKAKTGKFFALKVKGDSMFPYVLEDDIILFKQQNNCENGQICAVMVNGDDATIKIVKKDETGITLIPYNPIYPKIHYSNEEIIEKPVIIAGVFEELRRDSLNGNI